MEFTCVWSKDAQHKKRKRWTDGVARFSPTTGLLSVWDQEGSTKVSSTRLKPDETTAMLQEDGDETRLGGISIQIIANVTQEQHHHPTVEEGAPSSLTAPKKPFAAGTVVLSGGGVTPSLKRRAFKPFVSKLTPQPRIVLRNNDDSPAPSQATENIHPNTSTTLGSPSGSQQTAAAAGPRKRAGLGGSGRGAGAARRFHAPRSSGVLVAPSDTGVDAARSGMGTTRPSPVSGALSTTPAWQVSDRPGVRGTVAITGGSPFVTGVNCDSSVAGRSAAAPESSSRRGPDSVENPEDIVLEWTAGDSPQPLRVGASLARRLHPHQREGLKVLWECMAGRGGYEGRGAILADEMGLGKTATAIALCTCVLRHRRTECLKAAVVCPSSLVKNWANEFRKWCPLGGGAIAVDQAGAVAAQLVADFKIGAPARYPILVISYELYRNHGNIINATEGLGLIIADEGHRLKNSSETKTTRALKACPAVMRLVLTGTPMQNDLDEFFAVADFVNPGLLGTLKSFRSRYTRPIKAAWDREADDNVTELSADRTRELGEVTAKFVLRRTKDVIRGSLPPALEVVIFCRPSPRQLSLYERCIASSDARVLLFDDDEDDAGDSEIALGEKGGGTKKQQRLVSFQGVLPLISTLRRLCNHPDLVDVGSNAGSGGGDKNSTETPFPEESSDRAGRKPHEKDDNNTVSPVGEAGTEEYICGKENNQTSGTPGTGDRRWPGSWKVPRASGGALKAETRVNKTPGNLSGSTASGPATTTRYETEASGKVLVLEALLRAVRQECPGDKVVVTSNFTSALDVLGFLADRNGWGFLRLDGGTPSNARQSLVDRFNRAPSENLFLFFLSARAGGVGLNLVGANRIVIFDSDWNPATDDQAMARVWRLGQQKEVSMYRLLCTGTLEESIFQRQIFKGALYDLIHDSNDGPCSLPADGLCPAGSTDDNDIETITTGVQQRKGRYSSTGESRRGGASHKTGKEGRQGRGFSQAELKELFTLKTDTRSDTYDKLTRGRGQESATSMIPPLSLLPQEGSGHHQKARPHPDAGSTGRKSSFGDETTGEAGSHQIGGRRMVGTDAGEEWKDYTGPSGILDQALRRALGETGNTVCGDAARETTATVASSVVTFVREVKRGGEPAEPKMTG